LKEDFKLGCQLDFKEHIMSGTKGKGLEFVAVGVGVGLVLCIHGAFASPQGIATVENTLY
jgi:hypothetical protein